MLHFKDEATNWPAPKYAPMASVRILMQHMNRDVTKLYEAKIEARNKKAAEEARIAEEKRIAAEKLEQEILQEMRPSSFDEILAIPYITKSNMPKSPKNQEIAKLPTPLVPKITFLSSKSIQNKLFPSKLIRNRTILRVYKHRKIYRNITHPQNTQIVHFANNVTNNYKPIKIDDSFVNTSEYNKYKTMAAQANRDRKIFTIYGYYDHIRNALVERGWIEKIDTYYLKNLHSMAQRDLLINASKGNDYEKVLLSKMVSAYPTYFIWQPRYYRDTFASVNPYRNRIRRSSAIDFSTKVGLIGCAENSHWYTIDGVAEVVYPRFYRLENQIERMEFLRDYRVTQALALLNYITTAKSYNELFNNYKATVETSNLYFATKMIRKTINPDEEKSIYQTDPFDIEERERWRQFFFNSLKIINGEDCFHSDSVGFSRIYKECKKVLLEAKPFYKTLHMDGYSNIWIVKPGYQCRGSGIYIFTDYDKIIKFINKYPRTKYIVQKYIEKPLLVYNTKFDIRQYLLITFTDKINIWLYQDCYFRFSSQEFTLNDLRESIHLTNNSIQRKYQNGKRSSKLPHHNMWDLSQFQQYLKEIGKPDAWNKITYPGIKRIVTGIILSSIEETEVIRNGFEIYGCDFMLDENHQPILIEINATPDMSPSTVVTARICPAALVDLVKVVVDLPKNPKAPTGKYELIYQLDISINPTNPESLATKGVKVSEETPVEDKEHSKSNKNKQSSKSSSKSDKHKKKHKKSLTFTTKKPFVPKSFSGQLKD